MANLSTPANSTNVRLPLLFRAVGSALRLTDRIAPSRAANFAADLFLTPRRAGRPANEAPWHETAVLEQRTVAGHKIALWAWDEGGEGGEGRSVLLIHGWEGRGSQLGAFAREFAKGGCRAVAPDFPAHGNSPGRRTNLIEFAAIIRQLIEELEPAAIVAHSFGAAAVTVALRDVAFHGRLIYVAPPEDFNFFTGMFGEMLGITRDAAQRMQAELERRFDVDWSVLRGTAIAPTMTAPLLVIHDDDDRDVPLQFGKALAGAWPGARLITTSGLGHRRILRDPVVIRTAAAFAGVTGTMRPQPWPARGNALVESS